MFFQNPFQTAFLEGPSARLASKMRFWTDFPFSKDPEIDPWGDLFGQKGSKKSDCFPGLSVLDPTWARFGAENDPRSNKIRPLSVFGAKSRPGRPQDGQGQLTYSTFGAFLVENGAPRGHLGAQLGSKIRQKSHFWA